MEANALGPAQRAHLGHRLHRARLVVGPHHAHQRDLRRTRVEERRQVPEVRVARGIAAQPRHLGQAAPGERLACLAHRAVLRLHGDQHAPPLLALELQCLERTLDRQRRALGAAACEDDLAIARTDEPRHGFARQLHRPPRVDPGAVHARRIAPSAHQRVGDRRHHLGEGLRRGIAIEVRRHGVTVSAGCRTAQRQASRAAKSTTGSPSGARSASVRMRGLEPPRV